ncbi:MAG: hypothetical protein CSA61_00270 [Neptuniibacter caesariensis]|uniref:Uncharacterized protein n=1 Tax=Neptuniibacter caesariensis TaxID=207954 RepID=A0A2G6JE66_NEPCE|nr:MAG: hypothetical protein CSA61_00270 [Neptuniibacter caesariensis]
MNAEILANGLLILCALFLAGRCYKLGEAHDHTPSMVVSLSAIFIACSAAGNSLLQDTNQDTETLKRMLDNLAFFAAIPLIASAMVDNAWQFNWSKAAWGRWLLALFALFELCRRSEIGTEYSQIMSVLCALAIMVSAARLTCIISKLATCLAAMTFAASLLIFSPTSLITEQSNPALFALGLSISLLLIYPALSTGSARKQGR